jgi:hypothetical protein
MLQAAQQLIDRGVEFWYMNHFARQSRRGMDEICGVRLKGFSKRLLADSTHSRL